MEIISGFGAFLSHNFIGLAAIAGIIVLYFNTQKLMALVGEADKDRIIAAKPLLFAQLAGCLAITIGAGVMAFIKGVNPEHCAEIVLNPEEATSMAASQGFKPAAIRIDNKPLQQPSQRISVPYSQTGAKVDISLSDYVTSKVAAAQRTTAAVVPSSRSDGLEEPQ